MNNRMSGSNSGVTLTPLHHKLQKVGSYDNIRGNVRRDLKTGTNEIDAATKKSKAAAGVLELLELLQSSSGAIMNCEVSPQREQSNVAPGSGRGVSSSPPHREHNSSREQRTCLTPPRGLSNHRSASQPNLMKSRRRSSKKKERSFSNADFGFENFDFEPSIFTKTKKKIQEQDNESKEDENNSFYQDAHSNLGDFGNESRPKLRRRRSKMKMIPKLQRSSKKNIHDDEEKEEDQQVKDWSFSDGLDLHSSSEIGHSSEIGSGNSEEDQAVRRRRRRCTAGGTIRNNRTQEDYTGFFLASSTKENLRHGFGITKFADGRVFEGVYERGNMVEGKMTYPAALASTNNVKDPCQNSIFGATYVGKFDKEGLRCGKGIYTTATTTFLGEFDRGEPQGSGILIYNAKSSDTSNSKSRRFIGHWKDGLKHGYGREILGDGTILREGLWEDGSYAGKSQRRGQ